MVAMPTSFYCSRWKKTPHLINNKANKIYSLFFSGRQSLLHEKQETRINFLR